MKYSEQLQHITESNNGVLTTVDVRQAGIQKAALYAYVKAQNMQRVGRGVYAAESAWLDGMDLYPYSR